ncbi:hypothetical protein ACHAPJ_009197 [Fusarium lateritium]
MALDNIPNEVLGNIFTHLITDQHKLRLHDDSTTDIGLARLVCRRWNTIAAEQLFHTLPLWHSTKTAEQGLSSWHHLVNSSTVRAAARRVIIESVPWRQEYRRVASVWKRWAEKGEWPECVSAINQICDLPYLNAVEV